MLRVVLLLLILGVELSAAAQQRWDAVENSPLATGGRARHDDIRIGASGTGWLVNTRGQIWRTADSGLTWDQQLDTNGTYLFRSLAMIDGRNAYAGTVLSGSSVLFATSDGGDTWTDVSNRISGTRPAGICGMSVVNSRVIYGVGAFHGEAAVIKTTNGGLSWTGTSVRPLAQTLVDVHFFDESTGIAVGGDSEQLRGNAVVLRTEDGGSSWQRVYVSTRKPGIDGEWGWKITFPTPEVGYVSVETATNGFGEPAKVLKTTDGGRTWQAIEVTGSVSRAGLQGIGFISAEVGWASGRGVTSVTTDGGNKWTQLLPWASETQRDGFGNVTASPDGQLDGSVNRIVVVSDTLAVAVGRRVYRLGGVPQSTGIAREAPPDQFVLGDLWPNPSDGEVNLSYRLREDARVRIEVIDVSGRIWHVVEDARKPAGEYTATWSGTDASGRRVPAGVYFVLVDVGLSPEMKQVVLIR